MQNNSRFLSIDGVDRCTIREAAAEARHALRQTDLPQTFVALILGNVLGGHPACPATFLCILCSDGGVVDDLVANSLVGIAQGGVEDGKEAESRGDNGA